MMLAMIEMIVHKSAIPSRMRNSQTVAAAMESCDELVPPWAGALNLRAAFLVPINLGLLAMEEEGWKELLAAAIMVTPGSSQ
uniref:Uncharacterized protein n=1 Tax=Oryza barthii TaxID=65489 RepID=A0A0D3GDR4_9ORYZ